MKRELILVAAVAEHRVIGYQGSIPWWDDHEMRNEDMHHFKKLTRCKPVVMGRRTYESIAALARNFQRILPDRRKIVVSRSIPEGERNGVHFCSSLENAVDFGFFFSDEVYVIGGQRLYEQTIAKATRLELTEIQGRYHGDAFFPPYRDTDEWEEIFREPHRGYRFVTYLRKGASR